MSKSLSSNKKSDDDNWIDDYETYLQNENMSDYVTNPYEGYCIEKKVFPKTYKKALGILSKKIDDFVKADNKDYVAGYFLTQTEEVLKENYFITQYKSTFNSLKFKWKLKRTIFISDIDNQKIIPYMKLKSIIGMNGYLPVFKNIYDKSFILTCKSCGITSVFGDFDNDCCDQPDQDLTNISITFPTNIQLTYRKYIVNDILNKIDRSYFALSKVFPPKSQYGSISDLRSTRKNLGKVTYDLMTKLQKEYEINESKIRSLILDYNKNLQGYEILSERSDLGPRKRLRYGDTNKSNTCYFLATFDTAKNNENWYYIPDKKSLIRAYR